MWWGAAARNSNGIWAAERARAGLVLGVRSPARRLSAMDRCDGWTFRFGTIVVAPHGKLISVKDNPADAAEQ